MPHPPPLDPALQQLLDRQAIQDVLVRYCRAVDRADLALLRDCYHADATEDHGGTFSGSAQAYIDFLAPVLPRAGTMSHSTTNIHVEFDGPHRARVESHLLAFARLKKDGEKFDALCLARAVDRFERREGRWKIAARQLVWEWNHDMPMSEGWGRGIIAADPSVLLRGRKKPDDALYAA